MMTFMIVVDAQQSVTWICYGCSVEGRVIVYLNESV